MRKLIVWNVMTLDGYFAGPTAWDLDMHGTVWGDELEAFSLEQGEEIGTLLFGRRTYEGMAAHWTQETGDIADMMNGIEKAVASRTLESADWNNTRLLSGEATDSVKALKAEDGKDVFIFRQRRAGGGASRGRARRRIPRLPRSRGAGHRQSVVQAGQPTPRSRPSGEPSAEHGRGASALRGEVRRDARLSSSTRRLAEGCGPLVAYLEDERGAGFEVTVPEMPNPT
jgi:dihydrofolate reductase